MKIRRRTDATRAYDRYWRTSTPAGREWQKRHNTSRKKRYAENPEYRERVQTQERLRASTSRVKTTEIVSCITTEWREVAGVLVRYHGDLQFTEDARAGA